METSPGSAMDWQAHTPTQTQLSVPPLVSPPLAGSPLDWLPNPPQQPEVTYPTLPTLPSREESVEGPLQAFSLGDITSTQFTKYSRPPIRQYTDTPPRRSISVPVSPSRKRFGTSNYLPNTIADRAANSSAQRRTYDDRVRESVARINLSNQAQKPPVRARQTSAPPTPTSKRRSFDEYQQDAENYHTVVKRGRMPSINPAAQAEEGQPLGVQDVEEIIEEDGDSAWRLVGDIVMLSIVTVSEQTTKLSGQLFRAYEAMVTGERGRRNLRNLAMIRELFVQGSRRLLSGGCTFIIKSAQAASRIAGTAKRRLVEFQSRWDRLGPRTLQQPSFIRQPNILPPNSHPHQPSRFSFDATNASMQEVPPYTSSSQLSKPKHGPSRKSRSKHGVAPYSTSKNHIKDQRAQKAQNVKRTNRSVILLEDDARSASASNLEAILDGLTDKAKNPTQDADSEELVCKIRPAFPRLPFWKEENAVSAEMAELPVVVEQNPESSKLSNQISPTSALRSAKPNNASQAAEREVAVKLETPVKSVLNDNEAPLRTPLSELSSNLSSITSVTPPAPEKQVTWRKELSLIKLFRKDSSLDAAWLPHDQHSTTGKKYHPVKEIPKKPVENPIKSILKTTTDGPTGYDEALRPVCYPNDLSFEDSTLEELSIEDSSPEAAVAVPQTPPKKVAVVTADVTLDGLTMSTRRFSERQQAIQARKRKEEARKQAALAAAKAQRDATLAREKEKREVEEMKAKGLRRTPKSKLLLPLSAEWERKVDDAMAVSGNSHQVATSVKGVALSRKDFGTLLPQRGRDSTSAWVNDEIIMAYLFAITEWALKKVGCRRGQIPRYYAFSTFFYQNIREKGAGSVDRWAKKAGLGGEKLLQAECIFVPIHQHAHWTLLVISPLRKTIEYFDSLHGDGRVIIDKMKEYLRMEIGAAFKPSEWKFHTSAPSPSQDNGRDCGVFLATTAKMITLGYDPIRSYCSTDIDLQRRRMVAELINGGFEGDFALHEEIQ
ncbi:MAG: Smt3-specific protease [Icmadophila ericetorum]|nr:Smt3-specific protease [Icmadophila ericetorum]